MTDQVFEVTDDRIAKQKMQELFSADEIREAALQTGNVISFFTAMRLKRSESFYKSTKERIKGRNGLIVESMPGNEVA